MSGAVRQIIGSFEDIGKDVVREVTKIPKDIGQTAMESLGTSSGKPQSGHTQSSNIAKGDPGSAMEQISSGGTSPQAKQAIARAALEELSRKNPPPREPSVREKLEQEDRQKTELAAAQAHKVATSTLLQPSARRPKGDLYGIKAKRHGGEIGKNVKSD